MIEIDEKMVRFDRNENEPVRIVSTDTGEEIFTMIYDNDQDDLGRLLPEASLTGRIFLRGVTNAEEQPNRYILVPAQARVAAVSALCVDVLPTDSLNYLVVDARNVGSEYLVFMIQGSDVKEKCISDDDVVIMVVYLKGHKVTSFNEIGDYDRWLTLRARDFAEGRSSIEIGVPNSGIPVPVYRLSEERKYQFPDGSFTKLQDILAKGESNEPLFPSPSPVTDDEEQ
jgi:hypothetical protein